MTTSSSEQPEGISLGPAQIRVLAVLAEKEALTPDNYPLSLNALVNGCNQLSSRDPVMSLTEQEVRETLDGLAQSKLVAEVSQVGARVAKYEHRMRIQWSLPQDKLAILAILMLRGAQTAGEIRGRSGRLHEFSAIAEVEAALQFLMDKYPPLVCRLPREQGTKEARYSHTFLGAVSRSEENPEGRSGNTGTTAGLPSQKERMERLEAEVTSLRAELQALAQEFSSLKKALE